MPNFHKYAQETTIHGLKELIGHRSWWFRITWGVVMVMLTAFFIFEMHRSITKYMKKPTATGVEYERRDYFPEFALCSNDWPDPERLRRRGFNSTADQLALLSSVCPSVIKPTELLPVADKKYNRTEIKEELDHLEQEMAKSGGYYELLSEMMYDFRKDLNGSTYCSSCLNQRYDTDISIIVKDVGPCWLFKPGKLSSPVNRKTTYPYLEMKLKFPNGSLFNEQSTFFLYFGSAAAAPSSPEDAYVTPYASNMVDVNFILKNRVAKCNSSERHTDSACDAFCFDSLAKKCGYGCTIFMGYQANRTLPYDRLCNWLVEENIDLDCFFGNSDICRACQKQCEHLEATTSVSIRPKPTHHDMMIKIRLKNLYSIFEFKEYYSYVLTDLLSDFGGLLGLFLGASVISMVHTMYFCCIMPFTGGTKVKGDEDDEECRERRHPV